ncbi:MAG: methionyl-tRNA formyltransferase [Gammaproteobacteria bacterium]
MDVKQNISQMKIVIITQADPFYLGKSIEYLAKNLPKEAAITGCVVNSVSPFGKKESLLRKALKTYKIFGAKFFLRYGFRYIYSRFNKKNDVESVLKKNKIPIINLSKSINHEDSLLLIKDKLPDILISIGGNEIFKKPLIELAKNGCLNLHTAPLPKYRGLMPSFWVLKNKEKSTGVSVFFVDEGIDSGPILVQKKVDIFNQTQEELIRQTKKIGMECIIEALEKIMHNNIETLPNDDNNMSYYSFPTKEDVQEFKKVGAKFF